MHAPQTQSRAAYRTPALRQTAPAPTPVRCAWLSKLPPPTFFPGLPPTLPPASTQRALHPHSPHESKLRGIESHTRECLQSGVAALRRSVPTALYDSAG